MSLRQAAQQALEFLSHDMVAEDWPHQKRKDAVCDALRAALAEPEQPVAIKWALNGDKRCGYDNWLGETPFGRILITWKSWKEFPEASVDEFPGDFTAYGDPEKVKVECEAEFRRRIGAAPTPRKPQTTHWEGCEAVHPECRKPEQKAWFTVEELNDFATKLKEKAWKA